MLEAQAGRSLVLRDYHDIVWDGGNMLEAQVRDRVVIRCTLEDLRAVVDELKRQAQEGEVCPQVSSTAGGTCVTFVLCQE